MVCRTAPLAEGEQLRMVCRIVPLAEGEQIGKGLAATTQGINSMQAYSWQRVGILLAASGGKLGLAMGLATTLLLPACSEPAHCLHPCYPLPTYYLPRSYLLATLELP